MQTQQGLLYLPIHDFPPDAQVYVVTGREHWEIEEGHCFQERNNNLLIWRRLDLGPHDIFKLAARGLNRDLAWHIFNDPQNPWHHLSQKWFGWDSGLGVWWFVDLIFPVLDPGLWCENNLYDPTLSQCVIQDGIRFRLFEVV